MSTRYAPPVQSGRCLSLDDVRQHVVGIDAPVPLLDGSQRPYVNFDNAASTPALGPVMETVNAFLTWYASVHRGTGFKSQVATDAYEAAHEIALRFVGADPATHVAIFGKNSTEALNKLANRLPFTAGEVVLTTHMEHHSNDLPWRASGVEVEHVRVDGQGALDLDHLAALLERHAGRARLVAITGASNVTGTINPLHDIAAQAHAAGAEVLVDAAQLAPHRALNMRPLDDPAHLDYVVLSAHKLYAPFGTGALIGRRDTFEQGDPDMVGGGVVDMVTLDSVKWAELPDKEEAGSPNVVGAVAMAQAMLCLEQIGMDALAAHEAELTARLLGHFAAMDRVRVYGISDPARAAEKVGVVPFSIDGLSHYLVAAILSAEGGIGVRNGCFCAHPYILHLLNVQGDEAAAHQQEIAQGVKARLPGLVRASFGCYNTVEEVDYLAEWVARIAAGDYAGDYEQDPASGAYWPRGYAPETAQYFTLG